jgi:hypothetical protein
MMLRICNNNLVFNTWEDFFDPNSPMMTVEQAFTLHAKKYTHKYGFVLPEDKEDFWFYSDMNYNSKSDKSSYGVSTIHNCGVCSWTKTLSL